MSVTHRAPARALILALIAALAITVLPASNAQPVLAVSPDLVISQLYGGGGNSGATYTHDYVELYNRGSAPVTLNGKSIQYASAAGTGNFGANSGQLTELPDVSLAAGRYFLVAQASGANGAPLPGQDFTDPTPINMSGTAGKVALVTGTTTLGCNGGSTVCNAEALARIIDLVGYGGANFSETAPAPTLSNTTAGLRAANGATDTDDNSEDFTSGAPNPRLNTDPGPTVASTNPANGATDVATSAPISITFSEAVILDSATVVLTCSAGAVDISVGPRDEANPVTFDVTYLPPLPNGPCTLQIDKDGVHDTDTDDPNDTMAADVAVSFHVGPSDPCAGTHTPIPQLQGSGAATPASGTVSTEGVVVGDYEGAGGLRGFFIQDPLGDDNGATSDGIFVFEGSNADTVELGDNVRVTGTISEFQGQTQISVGSIADCGTDDTIAPTDVTFPLESATFLERYEGMLVHLSQTMFVTEHFLLGRFGQITISAESRLQNPTAVVDPGPEALALQAANDLRKIILDDGNNGQNVDPIVFGRGGQPLSATNTLRGGDTAEDIVGVMNWTFGGDPASPNAWRVRPVNALDGSFDFEPTNPRPGETVELGGNVRVAGLNLLNYFNTFDGLPDPAGNDNCDFGLGGAPADCRGADTQAEFDRQWPKTVAAIVGLDADVIGINEIENDGYGADSAIAHLVDRLNDATAPGTFAFIDFDAGTGQINAAGTDAIKVGIIYRPAAVTPVGTAAALNSDAFVNGGDGAPRSRPSLAHAFETLDGARFIVDVNHLKSKGSACDDADTGDGQGNCNVVRTNAANELATWLLDDPTGTGDADILIVGDLNSYAKEDPVVALETAGFINLVDEFVDDPYSYVFDGQWGYLDYAMGTATAFDQVAGVVEWHINSDEPSVLDYNTNFKPPAQLTSLYAPDRFRVSDHDPIIVGLAADSDRPVVDAGGPYLVEEAGTTQLTATGSDPTGDDVSYAWDLDRNGTFETLGASVTFSAGTLQAPQTVTVTVQITDEHGQSSTDTADIDVIWDFGGFAPPIDSGAPLTPKAGVSIPVKFSLDGFQGPAILDGQPTFQRQDCTTEAAIGDPISAAGGPVVYDPATDRYKFTWKTQKAWAGWCGTFSLHLADGQSHEFEVHFKD